MLSHLRLALRACEGLSVCPSQWWICLGGHWRIRCKEHGISKVRKNNNHDLQRWLCSITWCYWRVCVQREFLKNGSMGPGTTESQIPISFRYRKKRADFSNWRLWPVPNLKWIIRKCTNPTSPSFPQSNRSIYTLLTYSTTPREWIPLT
jgi:hypothetical protein